jgi:type I restriction enzyme S subunit
MTWGEFRPGENKRINAADADPQYEIRQGDLLVSRANTSAYVGASVLVGDVRRRLLLSDKSLRVLPAAGVRADWLNEVLQTPVVRRQISDLATGTKDSMRNISQKSLLSVSVPGTLPTQQGAVVARCKEIADSVRALSRSHEGIGRRSAALRRSLFAAAFSGRLTGRSSDLDLAEELSAMEPEIVPAGQEEALLW